MKSKNSTITLACMTLPFLPGDVDTSMNWRCGHVGLDDGAEVFQYELHHLAGTLDVEGVMAGDQRVKLGEDQEGHL